MPTTLKITDKLREKDRRESDDRRRSALRANGASYLANLGFYAVVLVASFVLWDLEITVENMVWAASLLAIAAVATWLFRSISDR